MKVTQNDLDWFNRKLSQSCCAEVKLFYLTLSTGEKEENGKKEEEIQKEDPLKLGCGTPWTLEKALRAARLIVCDERQIWERLGIEFHAYFDKPLDLWNEQNAIKTTYQFLSQRSPGVESKKEEERSLLVTLEAHAIAHIKPQQTDSLCGRERLQKAEFAEEDFTGVVKVVPMESGNDHSEGGLVCGRPVRAFGEILRVPRSALFYKDTILQYSRFGTAVRADPRLANLLENVEALLVMSFLYEFYVVGPENSHWRRLLLSCPRSFPTVPLFWEPGDLRELAGIDILNTVLKQREQSEEVARAMEDFLAILWEVLGPSSPGMALETFRSAFSAASVSFARAIFNSRAFNLNIDGNTVTAMVPLSDMINHQNRTDVLVRKVESNGGDFVILAGAPLTEWDIGRELWMSYGPLQNWELLYYYGFVMPQNEHDRLPFPLQNPLDEESGEEEEWGRRRRRLIENYHLLLHEECWLAAHGVPCEALRALLRVHLAQPEEFKKMESKSPFLPLSSTTELNIVQTIENVVRCILEQFPDSIDEDRASLTRIIEQITTDAEGSEEDEHADDPHALDNYKLCLQLRIALKEIAHRALEWCKDMQADIEKSHLS